MRVAASRAIGALVLAADNMMDATARRAMRPFQLARL
jgi:hypothetical protein